MTLAAGDWFVDSNREYARNSGSAAVTKGVLMKWDPTNDGYVITAAAADQQGPFAVCAKAATAGDTQVYVVTNGKVCATAGGTLEPNDKLQADTAVAGRVIVFTTFAITANTTDFVKGARDDYKRVVGRYVGKENLGGDGTATLTGTSGDASSADVVIIDLARAV